VLFFSRMVAYPFPSAATEAVVECSTERVRAFILFPHLKMVPPEIPRLPLWVV